MTRERPERGCLRKDPRRCDILRSTAKFQQEWEDPFERDVADPGGTLIGEMLLLAEKDITAARRAVTTACRMTRRGRTTATWVNEHPAFEDVCDYFNQDPGAERYRLAKLATKDYPGFWAFLAREGECNCPLCNSKIQFREVST